MLARPNNCTFVPQILSALPSSLACSKNCMHVSSKSAAAISPVSTPARNCTIVPSCAACFVLAWMDTCVFIPKPIPATLQTDPLAFLMRAGTSTQWTPFTKSSS